MVMQVRYLYEAEGNKKAKDAKAVSWIVIFFSFAKALSLPSIGSFTCLMAKCSYSSSFHFIPTFTLQGIQTGISSY